MKRTPIIVTGPRPKLAAAIALALVSTPLASDAGLIAISGGRGSLTQGGGTTDLDTLLSGMSSNSWATFTMGNLTAAIFTATGASDHSCAEFASKMTWDPVHNQLFFAGSSHTPPPLAGSGCGSTWDDATNQWTRETYTWSSDAEGHGYAHNTINTTTGDVYRRNYNSTTIKKRTYGTTGEASWVSGVVAAPDGPVQVSGGIEWFPELNGGNGGLVFIDNHAYGGLQYSNAALTDWTTAGTPTVGDYDINIAYSGGFVYFGGGGGSTNFYRMNSSGTVSSLSAFPFEPNQNVGTGMMLAAPNGTGVLLLSSTNNGDFRYFNGSSWSDLGNHQMSGDEYFLCGTIQEKGALLCVSIDSSGTATPVARVYKQ